MAKLKERLRLPSEFGSACMLEGHISNCDAEPSGTDDQDRHQKAGVIDSVENWNSGDENYPAVQYDCDDQHQRPAKCACLSLARRQVLPQFPCPVRKPN